MHALCFKRIRYDYHSRSLISRRNRQIGHALSFTAGSRLKMLFWASSGLHYTRRGALFPVYHVARPWLRKPIPANPWEWIEVRWFSLFQGERERGFSVRALSGLNYWHRSRTFKGHASSNCFFRRFLADLGCFRLECLRPSLTSTYCIIIQTCVIFYGSREELICRRGTLFHFKSVKVTPRIVTRPNEKCEWDKWKRCKLNLSLNYHLWLKEATPTFVTTCTNRVRKS